MNNIALAKKEFYDMVNTGLSNIHNETCGLVLGRKLSDTEWVAEEFHPITNVSKYNNEIDYQMEPQELMNVLKLTRKFNPNSDKELVAIFHTHPRGVAIPSMTDIKRVAFNVPHLIYGISESTVRCWMIDKANKSYESVEIKVI